MYGTSSERAASAIFGRIAAARKERELSGIERRNTAFTFVACPSVTHPLNGVLTRAIFASNKEKERERKIAGGGETERKREGEKRYLRICQFR